MKCILAFTFNTIDVSFKLENKLQRRGHQYKKYTFRLFGCDEWTKYTGDVKEVLYYWMKLSIINWEQVVQGSQPIKFYTSLYGVIRYYNGDVTKSLKSGFWVVKNIRKERLSHKRMSLGLDSDVCKFGSSSQKKKI